MSDLEEGTRGIGKQPALLALQRGQLGRAPGLSLGGCAASWQRGVRSGRSEASRFGAALRLLSCHRGEKESEGELGGIAEPRGEVGELAQLSWWLL